MCNFLRTFPKESMHKRLWSSFGMQWIKIVSVPTFSFPFQGLMPPIFFVIELGGFINIGHEKRGVNSL